MLSLKDIESYYPENLKKFKDNILHEYLQCKILEILFDSRIASKISFIGGTAGRIIYNTGRFSLDLDFDNFNLDKTEFLEVSNVLKNKLELEGFNVEIKTKIDKKTFHYHIRFPGILHLYNLTGHTNEKLLIKVDTEPQDVIYAPEKKLLNKFDVLTHIHVTPVDILLSMKIKAALTRKTPQGRDFYDIAFLVNKTRPNYNFLKLKLGIDSPELLKETLLSRCKTWNFTALAKDIENLIFNQSEI